MIRSGKDYPGAKEMMVSRAREALGQFDREPKEDQTGKNDIVRTVVESQKLEKCEYLAPRCMGNVKVERLEDELLRAFKTLLEKGYGFVGNSMVMLEDDDLTLVRSNQSNVLTKMLDAYFNEVVPIDPYLLFRSFNQILNTKLDFGLVEEYLVVGDVDDSLPYRLSTRLYQEKQFMYRVNECREGAGLFHYLDGEYRFKPSRRGDPDYVEFVIEKFDGYVDKYGALCRFFKIGEFQEGGLPGGGKIERVEANDFLESLELKKETIPKYLIFSYWIEADKDPVSFDPVMYYLTGEDQTRVLGCPFYAGPKVTISVSVLGSFTRRFTIKMTIGSGREEISIIMDPCRKMRMLRLDNVELYGVNEDNEISLPIIKVRSTVPANLKIEVVYLEWSPKSDDISIEETKIVK